MSKGKCENVKKALRLSIESELFKSLEPSQLSRSKSDMNLIYVDSSNKTVSSETDMAKTKFSSSNSLSFFSEEDKERESLKYLKALAKNIKNPIKRTEVRSNTTQNNDTVNKIIIQRRGNIFQTVNDITSSNLFLKLIPCLTEEDFKIELIECDDEEYRILFPII
jgi:hypothetical protein